MAPLRDPHSPPPTRQSASSLLQTLVAIIVAGLAGQACGGAPTDNGSAAIAVTVNAQPSSAAPGDTVTVTVTAVPQGDVTVERITLRADGPISVSETSTLSGPGAKSAAWPIALPLVADPVTIRFVGEASGGGVTGSGEVSVPVADVVDPEITEVTTAATAADLGATVTVDLAATDNAGLAYSVVRWQGAFDGVDSVPHQGEREIARTADITVPADAPLGQVLMITVEVADIAGHQAADHLQLTTRDLDPPTSSGQFDAADSTYARGETAQFSIHATDNGLLRWIGYRVGDPFNIQDSVAVDASEASHNFSLTVQPGWTGIAYVVAFARDANDNLWEDQIPGSIQLFDGERFPTSVVALDGSPKDLAFDPKRNRAYVTLPTLSEIAVVSLPDGAVTGSISAPTEPRGIDLSTGHDTIIVGLRRTPYIGLVDLTAPTLEMDTVRVGFDTFSNHGADNVRVMSNDQALISITFDGSGFGGEVWQYDFATGATAKRTDVGYGSSVTEATPLARSSDRTRLLLLIDDSCCPLSAFLYDAATDTFSGAFSTVSQYFPPVSADATGTRFLIGNELFDGDLNSLGAISPPGASPWPATAISPDGSKAFMTADGSGFLIVDTSTSLVDTRGLLPFVPARLWVSSDGALLVAASGSQLAIITLP